MQIPAKGRDAGAFADVGERDQSAGDRPDRSGDRQAQVPHVVQPKAAAPIDWQPLREFWFTGRDGRRIHNFIALPPNFDETKKYPLFVLIHGGHANMWRDAITYRWNYHLLSQPGFVVLMTDYRGSTGYGEKFTLDILGRSARGPGRRPQRRRRRGDQAVCVHRRDAAGCRRRELRRPSHELAGRHDDALQGAHQPRGSRDARDAVGHSDSIYHREVMMGGPYWENPRKWIAQSPLAKAGNFKTPMLLSVGEDDFRVPEGNTLAMYAALQRMNVPSRLIVWPDENHWILKGENSRVFYREVRAWLEKYLSASRAADRGGWTVTGPPDRKCRGLRVPPERRRAAPRADLDADCARRLAGDGLRRRDPRGPLVRLAVTVRGGITVRMDRS